MSTRLNKFIAQASGLSRRQSDAAIEAGNVLINGKAATLGNQVEEGDTVTLDGKPLSESVYEYVLVHKPEGYVCSRNSQDEKPTIYELLPDTLHSLKIAGRLDADSKGLVLLTNDGDYTQQLTHPSFQKEKRYIVQLDKELSATDEAKINAGIQIEDGVSNMQLKHLNEQQLEVSMKEGRNRQIRRTFDALGYTVTDLKRIQFGPYKLDSLKEGHYAAVKKLS